MSTAATTTPTTLGGFDDIMSGPDGIEFKEVKAWGKTYGLLSITAGEVLEWLMAKEKDPTVAKEAALRLLARSFIASDRTTRLCDTPEKEDRMVAKLRGQDSKTVNMLVTIVLKLNGVVEETATAAKNDSAASL